jgi:hypothetical protein
MGTYTYDETMPIGIVRFWMQDVDQATPIFTDQEVGILITTAGVNGLGQPRLIYAASLGMHIMAVQASKLAAAVKVGVFGTDTAPTYKAIKERAEYLQGLDLSGSDPVVSITHERFRRFGNTDGTMFNERPMEQW